MDPELLKRIIAMLGQAAPADATSTNPTLLPSLDEFKPSTISAMSQPFNRDQPELALPVEPEEPVELSVAPFLSGPGGAGSSAFKKILAKLGGKKFAAGDARGILGDLVKKGSRSSERAASMSGELARDVQASKVAGDVGPNINKMLDLIDELPAGRARDAAVQKFDDFMALQENLSKGFGATVGINQSVPELTQDTIAELVRKIMSKTGNN